MSSSPDNKEDSQVMYEDEDVLLFTGRRSPVQMSVSSKTDGKERLKDELRDNLTTGFDELRKTSTLTDVTLECSDGRAFPAHKVVLSGASPRCRALFSEDGGDRVEFKSVQPKAMEALLDYIYTGRLKDDDVKHDVQAAKHLLEAAQVFQLPSLNKYCWQVLFKMLSLSTFGVLLQLAEKYQNTDMSAAVASFVVSNSETVKQSSHLRVLSPEELKMLLASPIVAANPDWGALAVLAWVKHDLEDRRDRLEELFGLVNLAGLNSESLSQLQVEELVTASHPLLKQLFNITTSRMAGQPVATKSPVEQAKPEMTIVE